MFKYILLLSVLAVGLFGFLLPALFSAASTEAVLLGCLVVIVVLWVAFGAAMSFFKSLETPKGNENDQDS